MRILNGSGVCGGVARGKIYLIEKSEKKVKRARVNDIDAEIARFEKARNDALEQLAALYGKAAGEVGEESAALFEIHQMMLCDDDYIASVKSIIAGQGINAETAISITADDFAKTFSLMDDEYMKARAADVKDISGRVTGILSDTGGVYIDSDEPVIVAARELSPSEVIQLDKSKILAFVIGEGSLNSHASILMRMTDIPAIVCAEGIMNSENHMKDAIADGETGTVYIEPDDETKSRMEEKRGKYEARRNMLSVLKNVKPKTRDGREILIYANIGGLDDLPLVRKNGGQGVGLFRSELIYLESDHYPTENEQFAVYKKCAEEMKGGRAVIRTLDIGADKRTDYFDMPREENPAMGMRAIRLCLDRQDIFKTQLRALLRASAYGNLAVMFPMITSVGEVRKIKKIISEAKAELSRESVKFDGDIEIGVMIETPAAALISDLLAREVDFFSIGTNDLTQFTLAVDRRNTKAEKFCDKRHEAVLRLIKYVADNAHKNGIWVSVCGELGGDTELTEFFLSVGIDALSVSPGKIPELKLKVLETDVSAERESIGKYLKRR